MDDATKALVSAWLTKANHDLGSARKLAEGRQPYLDTALYHCQQAGEKAIKAFLTSLEIRFGKIHNIAVLIGQGLEKVPQLSGLLEAAETLTPFATLYRYPTAAPEPEVDEFVEALVAAELIYETVLKLLPEEVHPKAP